MKHICRVYVRNSDAKRLDNHQKWNPKWILNPAKIHPQIDQHMNVKRVTKRRSKRRVGRYGAPPRIVTYPDLPYTLYHLFVLYSLATKPSERPSGPLAAGAARF